MSKNNEKQQIDFEADDQEMQNMKDVQDNDSNICEEEDDAYSQKSNGKLSPEK